MLQRLARALDARDAELARDLLGALRAERGEADANVRLSGARLARLEGREDEALAMLGALARELPRQPAVVFHYAEALAAVGRFDQAGRWYLQASRLKPEWLEGYRRALQCAVHVARGEGFDRLTPNGSRESGESSSGARAATVHSTPATVLGVRVEPPPQSTPAVRHAPPDPHATTLLSVIVCSIDPGKLAALRANLGALLDGTPWELIHIGDAKSLAEGYTRGLQQARGARLVLCHDDIRILAPDFRRRLLAYLERYDLIGVAGSTLCSGPAVFWAGLPHAHGWVAYPDARGTVPCISSTRGPVVEGAQALDGLFLAARRELFERVAFDAETFDGFHFYDLDLSWHAHRAGARLAICQDLLIEHRSRGEFGQDWQRYAARFLAKYPELARTPASTLPFIFPAPPGDDAQARGVYAALTRWIATIDEALA
jgi:tetratricopeptide (TPR) repeat protein